MSAANLAVTAIFTALVCVATMAFSIYVPATAGFFNVGESMVFLAALLFGPLVGAFAGGVGSMLADIFLGFWYYAPATLVVKACEGAVVGWLRKRNPKLVPTLYWRLFTLMLGVAIGLLLGWIGTTYYSGEVVLTLGSGEFLLHIPSGFWLVLGFCTALLITVLGFVAAPEFGWTIFSVISGGFVMVLGYFLYQQFLIYPLFNITVIAILEIPVNIGQMVIGAIIALPTVKVVLRSLPQLAKDNQS